MKTSKLWPFILYVEINLKWIIDLNVCIKVPFLVENIGENFSEIRFGKYFLSIMKEIETKEKWINLTLPKFFALQ
jgi:hypothetical protein